MPARALAHQPAGEGVLLRDAGAGVGVVALGRRDRALHFAARYRTRRSCPRCRRRNTSAAACRRRVAGDRDGDALQAEVLHHRRAAKLREQAAVGDGGAAAAVHVQVGDGVRPAVELARVCAGRQAAGRRADGPASPVRCCSRCRPCSARRCCWCRSPGFAVSS